VFTIASEKRAIVIANEMVEIDIGFARILLLLEYGRDLTM
jgi:hypothetical protein